MEWAFAVIVITVSLLMGDTEGDDQDATCVAVNCEITTVYNEDTE